MRANWTVNSEANNDQQLETIIARATENARFKNLRLRRLKERNELYLAARRAEMGWDDEDDMDEELTKEL